MRNSGSPRVIRRNVCRRAAVRWWPAARQGGQPGRQLLANPGHGVQNRVGQFLDDVELADLVGNGTEDQGNGLRVKRPTIGCDPPQCQAADIQLFLELGQESGDVHGRGRVVQHTIAQTAEVAVVHKTQHAERAVVQFIGGDVAAEADQGVIQVPLLDELFAFFPPPPRPSSGS